MDSRNAGQALKEDGGPGQKGLPDTGQVGIDGLSACFYNGSEDQGKGYVNEEIFHSCKWFDLRMSNL